MKIDYLIIGQGLAGSLLGWELIRRNQKILIVDNGEENASRVAGGLINPVTGMRFVKTADVDGLLNTAYKYYADLECFFSQRFFYEKPMLRLLRNEKELQAAEKRLTDNEYKHYLTQIISDYPGIISPLGLLQQKQTGHLLTIPLLKALKQFFIATQSYLKTTVDYQQIQFHPQLQWHNIQPKQIIFCEGHRATNNPWFKHLPFQPVKGEILTAETSAPLVSQILNYGHWLIPLDSHRFKTGATYDRENLSTQISYQAQQALLSSLQKVYPALLQQIRIINHKAGVRPATLDKLPFIGHHPDFPKLSIFNGFGSKGSLLIPYFCQQLANTLLNKTDLPESCNIKRYYDSHFLT